jgi:glucose-1-phosphate thymidylyltransferase
VEKPSTPPSNFAIGGIYLFDETFWDRLDRTVEEMGDKMSITDVNRTYVLEGKASIIESENSLWIDCGTPDALLEASQLAAEGKLSPEPSNYRDGDAPL